MRPIFGPCSSIVFASAILMPASSPAQVPKVVVPKAEMPAVTRPGLHGPIRVPAPPAVPALPLPLPRVDGLNHNLRALPPNNLENFKQQWIDRCRPILHVEYHFVRTVCELTPQERKQIAGEGERILEDAVREFVERRRNGRVVAYYSDPFAELRRLIQEGLARVVQAQLSPERTARYQREVEERAENRKRVAIHNVVAKIDQDLILSAEQRKQIGDSLSAHWKDAWTRSLDMLLNVDQYFFFVPDQAIVPFLNETQMNLWIDLHRDRIGRAIVPTAPMTQGDSLEDEDLVEARRQGEP